MSENGAAPSGRREGSGSRLTLKDFANHIKSSWCPGCGDFGVLAALKQALVKLGIAPHQAAVISGIGCGSKIVDYMRVNGFMTLHGRPLAVATGVKLANPDLHVIVVNGDGDAYGIGGNHFLHAARRNPDITHIVENNQIYALTKGQYSPTSDRGFKTSTSPDGAAESPVNPLLVALAAGATFIARSFAGEPKHLAEMIAAGIRHRGYALIDVLQPCVTFNKVNTYEWYAERIYRVDEDEGYDPADFARAWQTAGKWGDRIPVGIIYQRDDVPPYEEHVPALKAGAVVHRPFDALDEERFAALKREFM